MPPGGHARAHGQQATRARPGYGKAAVARRRSPNGHQTQQQEPCAFRGQMHDSSHPIRVVQSESSNPSRLIHVIPSELSRPSHPIRVIQSESFNPRHPIRVMSRSLARSIDRSLARSLGVEARDSERTESATRSVPSQRLGAYRVSDSERTESATRSFS